MSTADSSLHAVSAVFTRDVYVRHFRKRASERERAWAGRSVMVFATACAVVLAWLQSRSTAFSPYVMIAQMGFLAIAFSTQLLPVTVDVLFLRRGTRAGAIAGILVGLGTLFFFTPFFALLGSGSPSGDYLLDVVQNVRANIDIGCFALIGNVAAFVIVSSFTKKPDPETVESFRAAACDSSS